MADLYTPRVWVDGEQLTAVNSANRWETGIESLDLALDDLYDQVAALLAGGGTSRQFQSGPTAERPSPAIGLPYWDTSLGTVGKLIIGTGTSWAYPDGTLVEGAGGGGTAPRNMRASVIEGGTIGAIVLAWDAVAGATSYKLYELESPSGVAGAEALTTTTTTRTPGTARNYEYWVTALVAGVESAASNRAQAVLPYTGGGEPPPSSSDPSTFLNINGKGNGQGGWWNLGIGFPSGHTDITPSQLQNGYVNTPYYVMNSAGTAVQMQVFMNGGRTSTNTKYPRCEFREMQTGSTSTKASWNGRSGRHIMRGKTKAMHYAPEKCEKVVAQIHDGSDDRLQIRAEAGSPTGSQTWRLSLDGTEVDDLISGVALGQEVAWEIDVNGTSLTVKINGTTQYTTSSHSLPSSGNYFKVGEYVQQNSTDQDNPSSEYGRSELRDLFVSHS
jgi:Alginate lyase